MAWLGWAWRGMAGIFETTMAWLGWAWHGQAGLGEAGIQFFTIE